jgi:hypothetical protein
MLCDSVELVSVQATVHKEHNCARFQDFLTDLCTMHVITFTLF